MYGNPRHSIFVKPPEQIVKTWSTPKYYCGDNNIKTRGESYFIIEFLHYVLFCGYLSHL